MVQIGVAYKTRHVFSWTSQSLLSKQRLLTFSGIPYQNKLYTFGITGLNWAHAVHGLCTLL